MAEMYFSNNYQDLSVSSGANAGFQFEFACQRCSDAWRSEFVSYRGGQASSWLGKASGLLGGMLGGVTDAADSLAAAGFGKARDAAFRQALEAVRRHFHRCARCSQYICERCWNTDRGLCLTCAPDAEVDIEAARAEGEREAAREKALTEGRSRGEKRDVQRARQLACPACGAETHGAKFCPECGAPMAVASHCPECSAEVPAKSKFCPECGHKMA